jgi:hypothetical protein
LNKNTFLRSDIETQAKTGDRGLPVGLQEAAYRPEIDALEHCVGSQVIAAIRGATKTGRGFLFVCANRTMIVLALETARVIGSALIKQSHTLRLASYSKSPTSLYSGASAAIRVLFCGAEK